MAGLVVGDGEADTALVARYEATRREAVRRGLAAGGVVLGASLIPALLSARDTFAATETDAAILSGAIVLENTAVAAYAAALTSGKLDAAFGRVARLFGGQEREHAAALASALRAHGGTPPTATDAKLLAPLGKAHSQADLVAFLLELEAMAVAAYHDALRKLRDTRALRTGVEIIANEGQHLAVLRQALNRNPVPNALETGAG